MRLILKIAIILMSLPYFAQENMPIQPEETPYLLAKNQIQLETTIGHKKESENHIYAFPVLLVKYGLGPIEMRCGTEYSNDFQNEIHGFATPIVGFKTKLWKEKNWLPESALVVQTNLPFLAHENFKTPHLAPEALMMMQGNYGKHFSINYNYGLKWNGENTMPSYTYKHTFSYLFTDVRWCFYTDWMGVFTQISEPSTMADVGVMYQLDQNMMLDLSIGKGLNAFSPHYFSALIFSIRI